jgi:hypothetical protein
MDRQVSIRADRRSRLYVDASGAISPSAKGSRTIVAIKGSGRADLKIADYGIAMIASRSCRR